MTSTDRNQCSLCIEIPSVTLDESGKANLRALVDSKRTLLMHAFGQERIELEERDGKIGFPWFDQTDAAHAKAYGQFVSRLCDLARSIRRVNRKEPKEIANEKYAFRCFLIRLGFVGDEYRESRRILLENLSGSSAFRDVSRH